VASSPPLFSCFISLLAVVLPVSLVQKVLHCLCVKEELNFHRILCTWTEVRGWRSISELESSITKAVSRVKERTDKGLEDKENIMKNKCYVFFKILPKRTIFWYYRSSTDLPFYLMTEKAKIHQLWLIQDGIRGVVLNSLQSELNQLSIS
jgi:hypothetical protein